MGIVATALVEDQQLMRPVRARLTLSVDWRSHPYRWTWEGDLL